MENERRVIRKLTAIAERKNEERKFEKRESERVIFSQSALMGDLYNKDSSSGSTLRRKEGTVYSCDLQDLWKS